MGDSEFDTWVKRFEDNADRRKELGDPDWERGSHLTPAVVRSLQRFQTGEEGEGQSLVRAAQGAGDSAYLAAIRLFIAEEQNHARMLSLLLAAADEPTIDGHWTDTVFVGVRRAMGLRLELMTLMVAEVVALRYYRALAEGTTDALLAEVAARVLADEDHHVAFHVHRLNRDFAGSGALTRSAAIAGWWVLLSGAACVVALDHGAALRDLGVGRLAFVRDVLGLFGPHLRETFTR